MDFRLPLTAIVCLILLQLGTEVNGGIRQKREEHALIKVIKSHAHIRPPRRFIPTISYMAPGPYYSIPYYKTEPYSSGGIYQSFIPHDAYQ
ncbi:hypothetical protein GHT06_010650 [Daphnia sinensis]|uniref:Uncharacterized protein n=1 Tax=Daphnia sinensis TaxID=1820382 RepID=A0AAD5PXM6_9CRUS|nr:hypothetical protein GHT06_010650 [Daphnia sinensis]